MTTNVVTALGILISIVGLAVMTAMHFNLLSAKGWWWVVGFNGLASVALGFYYNDKGGVLQIIVGVVLIFMATLMISTRVKA